jgi:hypothetical protein
MINSYRYSIVLTVHGFWAVVDNCKIGVGDKNIRYLSKSLAKTATVLKELHRIITKSHGVANDNFCKNLFLLKNSD